MGLAFHGEKSRYFQMQQENAVHYLLPFIETHRPLKQGMRVMDIGCGEGGVLNAFLDRGLVGIGVELSEGRVRNARKFLAEPIAAGQAEIISKDIHKVEIGKDVSESFDIIVLKDVIEHIHDQEKMLHRLQELLKPDGLIFFGFPPWQMPFGGHQQIADGKLAKLPYYHLLPRGAYKKVLKWFGQTENKIEQLLEIHDTKISIEDFKRLTAITGYEIIKEQFYLINPIYKYKFNLKPRRQARWLGKIPGFRNYVTTCCYYLVGKKNLGEKS